jgi:hypothetical protein
LSTEIEHLHKYQQIAEKGGWDGKLQFIGEMFPGPPGTKRVKGEALR